MIDRCNGAFSLVKDNVFTVSQQSVVCSNRFLSESSSSLNWCLLINPKMKNQSHRSQKNSSRISPKSFQLFKRLNKLSLGLTSPVGVLRARRSFAAITGPKFRIESYPLVASSQHVGAAAAFTILQLEFMLLEQ